MNAQEALDQLGSNPENVERMTTYHKVDRPYLGVETSVLDAAVKGWRTDLDVDLRLALARDLWDSNVHEGRIAAAKLLTQARIRPDDTAAWDLICAWVPEIDCLAIADKVATAGQKRLVSDPARLDIVADWIASDHAWSRRAAFTFTLPWTQQNHPKPEEIAVRERVLDWAEAVLKDKEFVVQDAIAGWLRHLSKHDPETVATFVDRHAEDMKKFVRKEASRNLG
ncbi:DNA alkylation repair protein [Yoonia sp. MH D7]